MRLAIAAATGRSTQKLPITMREITIASSPLIASLPAPDLRSLALLGEQPLGEIHAFLQLGHVLTELLHLGDQRVALLWVGSWSPIFFFQAEDGIRDLIVTGVQTC